jgi:YD repeat-containing protein
LPDVLDAKGSRVYINPAFTNYGGGATLVGRAVGRSDLNLEAEEAELDFFGGAGKGVTLGGYWGHRWRTSLLWRTKRGVVAPLLPYDTATPVVPGYRPNQEPPFELVRKTEVNMPRFDVVGGDIDGDGLPDALGRSMNANAPNLSYTYFARHQPTVAPERYSGFVAGVAANVQPKFLSNAVLFNALADVNGDGVADLIVSTEPRPERGGLREFAYYPGNGQAGFGCSADVEAAALFSGTCEETPTHPGTYGENATLAPAKRIRLSSLPVFSDFELVDHRPLFVDMDGDGLVDFVDAHSDRVSVYLNIDGHSFNNACLQGYQGCNVFLTAFEFPVPQNVRVTATDFDGNGTMDLVGVSQDGVKVLSFAHERTPGTHSHLRPGLLSSVHNNMGVRTTFEYYESLANAAYIAAGGTPTWLGAPGAPWRSFSEQAAQPVQSVETVYLEHAALERRTKEVYGYWDPAYDVWERRLVGFRRRSVGSVKGSISNVTVTLSHFGECEFKEAPEIGAGGPVPAGAQGCSGNTKTIDRLIRGMPYWVEKGDGARLLSATTFAYEVHRDASNQPYFAMPKRSDTYIYDQPNFNPSASTPASIVVLDHHDPEGLPSPVTTIDLRDTNGMRHIAWSQITNAEGLVTQFTQHGDVEQVDGDLEVATEYQCGLPPNNWACDAQRTTVRGNNSNGAPATPRVTEVATRDLTSGRPKILRGTHNTAPVNLDRATASSAPAAPAQGTTFYLAEYTYDSVGNVIEAKGPAFAAINGTERQCQETGFDTVYRYFPILSRVCGTQPRTDRTFDWVSGQLLTSLEQQIALSTVEYDGLGRVTARHSPDPVAGLFPALSAEYTYYLTSGDPLQRVRARAYKDAETYQESWYYADGAGSPLYTVRQGETWETPEGTNWIVEGLHLESGRDVYVHRPFGVSDPASVQPLWYYESVPGPRMTYDDFGRLTETWYAGQRTGRREYHGFTTQYWDREHVALNGAPQLEITVDGFSRVKKQTGPYSGGFLTSEFEYQNTHEATRVLRYSTGGSGGAPPYERWMAYDSFGRLVLNVEPNTSPNYAGPGAATQGLKTWRYVYDNAGHLVGTSDARGCGKNLAYDYLGRIAGEDYAPCEASHQLYSPPVPATGEGFEVVYTYGNTPGMFNQLVGHKDRGSEVTIDYDFRGRTTNIEKRVAKPDAGSAPWATRFAAHVFGMSFEYDGLDRLTKRDTGADAPCVRIVAASLEM